MSIPNSRASFFAEGEIRTRVLPDFGELLNSFFPLLSSGLITASAFSATSWPITAGISAGRFSPFSKITARTLLQGTSSPTSCIIIDKIPLAGDSTSLVALSVSISRMGSPSFMTAPSFTNQLVMCPSVMFIPSFGIVKNVAI